MEEMESPVEGLEEKIHELAQEVRERWLTFSALMSAILAVMASIAGLQSGNYANLAMVSQIESSDAWSYYQAKGIKAMVFENTSTLPLAEKQAKHEKYLHEQEAIKDDADRKVETAKQYLEQHEKLARAVSMFQIAIAITAISVLTRKRAFLGFALLLGVIGLCFFGLSWVV